MYSLLYGLGRSLSMVLLDALLFAVLVPARSAQGLHRNAIVQASAGGHGFALEI